MSRQIEAPHPKYVPVPYQDRNIVKEPEMPYGSQYKLDTVYGVFLMNFKEKGLEAKFRTDTVIADRETGVVINPHFRQIYLQFPYFTKELEECDTSYDKLIYALKNMSNWNRMPDALKEQVFQHLEQLAAVANLSEENRIAYDKALDRYQVNRIVEEDIRREATEEGMKKGIKEGIKEGKKEAQLKIATQLKKEGVPMDIIMKATDLSQEEIEKL